MAVQKSKKSHSRKGMRRSHDALGQPTLSLDDRGKLHARHHMSDDGFYRGRQIKVPQLHAVDPAQAPQTEQGSDQDS